MVRRRSSRIRYRTKRRSGSAPKKSRRYGKSRLSAGPLRRDFNRRSSMYKDTVKTPMNVNNVRDIWNDFNLKQELSQFDTDTDRINNNEFVNSVNESAEFIHLTDYMHTNKNGYLFSSAVVDGKKLQDLNKPETLNWLKYDFKAEYIKINENPLPNNRIIAYIIHLIQVANSAYENMIDEIESIDQKIDNRIVIKPFSNLKVKETFAKYIRAIKMIRDSNNMIISRNKINAEDLFGPYTEVGNLCLSSIAYYIIRTTQRNNYDLFDIAINGGIKQPEHKESDILIILVLRLLIKYRINQPKYGLKYYERQENKTKDLQLSNPNIFHDIKEVTDKMKPITTLEADWENRLLKVMAYVFEKKIMFDKIETDAKNHKNIHVLNNGVIDLYALSKNKQLCSLGNKIDGWSNPKCSNDKDIIKQSFDIAFDSGDTYKVSIKDASVELGVKLLFGDPRIDTRNKLELYSPGNSVRVGTSKVKLSLYTKDLEAANAAQKAFSLLFKYERLNETPRTDQTEMEFTRLTYLLNTEFLDDPTYIRERNNDRSLFSKFYGCFLIKTTGDTTQYIEANTSHLITDKYIYKVDNDRPAWVGDLVFRALAKPHIKDESKIRKNRSASGYTPIDQEKHIWCDDTNNLDWQKNGMLAWKMIFLIDTFHDYGYGMMSKRFKSSLNQLALLNHSKSQTGGFNSYEQPTPTKNYTILIDSFMTCLIMNNINVLLDSNVGTTINYEINNDSLDKASNLLFDITYKQLLEVLETHYQFGRIFNNTLKMHVLLFNESVSNKIPSNRKTYTTSVKKNRDTIGKPHPRTYTASVKKNRDTIGKRHIVIGTLMKLSKKIKNYGFQGKHRIPPKLV
jgi:hypothetical protein